MTYNPNKRHRCSVRLRGYDYARAGTYFVTICTQNRACLFGEIIDGEMVLNDAGHIAEKYWRKIPVHFPHAELGAFVVMPNHLHGIIVIVGANVGAKDFSPLRQRYKQPQTSHPTGTSKTIGSIVRGFKIGVTKWMRRNTTVRDVWQRNYYEHIVRNENELNRIRRYIIHNPAKWQYDRENPHIMQDNNIVRETLRSYGEDP